MIKERGNAGRFCRIVFWYGVAILPNVLGAIFP